ncbi:Homeobox domain-containing protein [Madurella fahalii]|uniref:Homeobox domain-containing protein n=1 Tax=Madurella fahalii TaxID=1157608 RepID=A0ABQ0G048_9PEZI
MDMDYMDHYRQRYAGLAMHPYGHQQQPQSQGPQHPYWNQLMAYYQHQQRTAALMGQGNMHLSKPTEPKPRLAKDEVELLEREFAKNPKPSSSTKRELAEQMGVEVPRINNWFQNRRAKEKQMRKTAEFEAQQARERAASEAKSSDEQDQGVVSEFYGLSNQHQPLAPSTATFGDDEDAGDSDDAASRREPVNPTAPAEMSAQARETPDGSDCDGFVRIKYESSASPAHHPQGITELASPAPISGSFGPAETQAEFPHPTAFAYRPADGTMLDGLQGPDFESLQAHGGMGMGDAAAFSPFSEQDYFVTPSVSQFPPEMVATSAPSHSGRHHPLRHYTSDESLAHSDAVSPTSMPESPSTVSDLRFKSPPPPADIAGRRKMRRPAPLGPSSLRVGPGPKTGIDAQRRTDTASPMRRISSATGSLCGRVQKTFMGPPGPRSPFATDRTKEALLQSLQGTTTTGQAAMMASLNSAMSPISSDGQCSGESTVIANVSDEEQGYPFGSLGAMGGLPTYKTEPSIKTTPPGTPGVPMGFHEPYFPGSMDHTWNFVPQDEPLPTPSLCSHGGSELEFSMAPQLPGYIASQPVTPSFPPTLGPAYNGFFGTSLGAHTEYHFPDSSYQAESSTRSSPVAPPRSKQFQFAQNITPQDFTDKP